jgi:hypothetical protein
MRQHPNWVEKYGRFELDMTRRLDLGLVPAPDPQPQEEPAAAQAPAG